MIHRAHTCEIWYGDNRKHIIYKVKSKGKAIPVKAWRGAEGSRRLGFPDFMTIGT